MGGGYDVAKVNAALVLEGGSLRCLYTAGVLDFFMEKEIDFSCVIGVSAGALTAANYITNQKRRTAQINIVHSSDSNYYGIKQLVSKRRAFNFDYLFYNPINQLYPYDIHKLEKLKQKFYIAATDCITGQIKYFEAKANYDEMTEFLRASSSLPLLAPMVKVEGKDYLDGGIVAPIGIEKAFEEQYDKVVVVLTTGAGFIKKPQSLVIQTLFALFYKKYPALLKSLRDMPQIYNDIRKKVDELEKVGKIFVIQPNSIPKMGNVEKDARKLTQLYFQGLDDAEKCLDKMKVYLGIDETIRN